MFLIDTLLTHWLARDSCTRRSTSTTMSSSRPITRQTILLPRSMKWIDFWAKSRLASVRYFAFELTWHVDRRESSNKTKIILSYCLVLVSLSILSSQRMMFSSSCFWRLIQDGALGKKMAAVADFKALVQQVQLTDQTIVILEKLLAVLNQISPCISLICFYLF